MIYGLTGGIASGKSFCSDYLHHKGIAVVDADDIAHAVLAPGSIGLEKVVAAFGVEIIDEQGQLKRTTLRQLVFADDNARQTLNDITHPLIRQSLVQQLKDAEKKPYALLSAPLLFENNLQCYCHATIMIDVPQSLQVARGSKRDKQDEKAIKAIIAKQMPRREKIIRANYLIDNSGNQTDTRRQLDCLHEWLLNLSH